MKVTGRPLHFKTPKELESAIDKYFEARYNDGRPITMSGLGLHLGFVSRQSFTDYAKRGAFSDIIKKARYIVEANYEENLSGHAPTGSIFALKHMGWKDNDDDKGSNTTIIIKDKDKDIVDRVLSQPSKD